MLSWGLIGVTGFAMLTGSAALGAALGLTGLLILHFQAHGAAEIAVQSTWNLLNTFSFSAIPMFVLLGEVLVGSGLSGKIYGAMTPLFSRVPGRLLHTNIAVSTVFGAVSGSSSATAAAIGSVAYPELRDRGYARREVLGTLAAGGTLGLLIPPSLSLIVYGAWQEVSIGRLFLAGMLPGLMMGGLFMVYIAYMGLRRPEVFPDPGPAFTWGEKLRLLLNIWPLLILIAAVLGSIYAGLATVTEAAGLGVLAATILGVLFGTLTFKGFLNACFRAVSNFGALFFVIVGATILAQSISILGIPRELVEYLAAFDLGPYQVLFAVVVMYVILGCFFDGISLMLMTLPFVFPLLTSLGFDPVWLGVLITIMIEIGMITPPVGVNLYVLAAVAKNEVALGEIAKASLPYWLVLLLGALLLTVFPQIALFIPTTFG